jgi:hypothetical protein
VSEQVEIGEIEAHGERLPSYSAKADFSNRALNGHFSRLNFVFEEVRANVA